MTKKILNRKIYKSVKKMDRQEMEKFLKDIYKSGFQDGAESAEGADFKIKLMRTLKDTKGVGEKTIEKVMRTVKLHEKLDEEVKNLAVLNRF